MKRCDRCREVKPLQEFWVDRSISRDGHRKTCIDCELKAKQAKRRAHVDVAGCVMTEFTRAVAS